MCIYSCNFPLAGYPSELNRISIYFNYRTNPAIKYLVADFILSIMYDSDGYL